MRLENEKAVTYSKIPEKDRERIEGEIVGNVDQTLRDNNIPIDDDTLCSSYLNIVVLARYQLEQAEEELGIQEMERTIPAEEKCKILEVQLEQYQRAMKEVAAILAACK